MEKPVSFVSDGLRLYGVLGLPDDAPRGAMVLVHGWSGYRIGPHGLLVAAARQFTAAGMATLRFDLRGRGDSEGDEKGTDLDDMIADTCHAIEFLRDETGIEQVALLGICSGANVAIGAATLEHRVDALILWSVLPFQPDAGKGQELRRTKHFALGYARKLFRPETWKKLVRGRINFRMVRRVLSGRSGGEQGERNLKDSRRDIMAAFAHYDGRAFFVHGSRDPEAPPARAIFIPFCETHGIPVAFHRIEGANHSYYSLAWTDRLITMSRDWLLGATAGKGAGT